MVLIKPQFEVGKGLVGKGGVVRDPLLREKVVDDLLDKFLTFGLHRGGCFPSPILGPKGNQEYLVLLTPKKGAVNMTETWDTT